MENVNCNELNLGHRYGLWGYESNNEVSRVCDKCGYVEILPVTSEVLEEIKNQIKTSEQRKQDNEIASRLINAFATLSINDSNLIGYLNVVLRDSFDYLNIPSKCSWQNFDNFSVLSSKSSLYTDCAISSQSYKYPFSSRSLKYSSYT